MASNEPKLLFTVPGINAYHLQDGEEQCLTPSGPQTLSLLMVPTSSPFSGLSNADPQSQAPEEDFYLHLNLPPELDLPLPATTQIYHQPPTSYLIPRWDMGADSGAFTRIEFPTIGQSKCTQDDVDTFETILAQCTAFLERASAPKGAKTSMKSKRATEQLPPYDPSSFAPGQGYAAGSSSSHAGGQIVLIDEENGSVMGELGEGYTVVEDSKMQAGSKDPVEITLPQDGSHNIGVAPVSNEYLEMSMHPAYKNSTLVSKAALASRLIVTTSSYVSNTLQSQANNFTQKTKPNAQPMTFSPTTHTRIRKINTLSENAVGLSAKTVGQVSKYAQNLGATLARRGESERKQKGFDKDGKAIDGYKPGLLNKSLMAFSTIADGVDQAGRHLLNSTSVAATTVVGHKYGPQAGEISKHIGGGFKNVGLVYIDATGVSRKAVIKSVAKGMVVGKVKGGGDLIVGGGDGGVVTDIPATKPGSGPAMWNDGPTNQSSDGKFLDKTGSVPSSGKKGDNGPAMWNDGPTNQSADGRFLSDNTYMSGGIKPQVEGFGRAAPPPDYSGESIGESIEGSKAPVKR